MNFKYIFLLSLLICFSGAYSKEIFTNAINLKSAPEWLKTVRVEKVTDKVQSKLEWSVRRIDVLWYTDQKKFENAHGHGPSVRAFAKNKGGVQTMHIGPQVTDENFDHYFAHELVHIIFYQKYKGAIPKWLEEGFANHIAQKAKVDYRWLAAQTLPADIHKMTHPFKNAVVDARVHYVASQALVEMLDKKCDLENLLRLSVERKMKDYIKTYCQISDINFEFQQWVKAKSNKKV